MFHPISFNVIRQALEWHAMPVPALRMLSWQDRADEFIAEYRAVWQETDLPRRYSGFGVTLSPAELLFTFREDLEACFCRDVAIAELGISPDNTELTALLYVRVDKAVSVLYEWLNGEV